MVEIATFTADGLRATVLRNGATGRYHVTLADDDAGQTLPIVVIYAATDEAAAVAYAASLVV